jgi:hypothetical protein
MQWRNRIFFVILGGSLLAITRVSSSWASDETRLALVIGNSSYPSMRLSSPTADADAMTKKLVNLGFAVREEKNLDHTSFDRVIREFGSTLPQGSVALFYYSGHGAQINNHNYMIPVDSDIHDEADVESYAPRLEDVVLRMQLAQSNPNIVILDACRDNPFEKRLKSSSGAGLAPFDNAPPATLVAYAAAPGHTAQQGLHGHLSRYTQALVKLMGLPGRDLINTFHTVQDLVYRETHAHQSPYVEFSPGLADFAFSVIPSEEAILASNLLFVSNKYALQIAIQTSERIGQPLSAQFEIDYGQLFVSIYTAHGSDFTEVVVDPKNGTIIKSSKISDADDVKDATEQKAALSSATVALLTAAQKSLDGYPGSQVVGIFPEIQNGHAVAVVTLLQEATPKKVIIPLD